MLQLCEIIEEYGNKIKVENGINYKIITFGYLFNIYEYISDKVWEKKRKKLNLKLN